MKNSKLSLIATLLPALFFMGASSMVYATGGGSDKANICIKNSLPAGKVAIVKYTIESGSQILFWDNRKFRSGTLKRGQQFCEKYEKGKAYPVYISFYSESGFLYEAAKRHVSPPKIIDITKG